MLVHLRQVVLFACYYKIGFKLYICIVFLGLKPIFILKCGLKAGPKIN